MYKPSQKILENYSKVLINFALNNGKGMKKKDVVYIAVQSPGIPLALEIYKTVLKNGGIPITNIIDDRFKLSFLTNASTEQLKFFAKKYYKGISDTIDHWVSVIAEEDPMFLKNVNPQNIILSQQSAKPFRDWLDHKEDKNLFSWTLCLYGTEGMAKEAGLSYGEYWKEIENACFLNEKDPLKKWKNVFDDIHGIIKRLNKLPIDKIQVKSDKTDLSVTLGEKRKWLGGSGRNIPSFEIFTSPDWRGTEGKIFFDLPLYRYGNIIKDISLEFKNGKIVKASAAKNEKLLLEMIKQKNADKIGEFSLTDTRFSRISKFMATTLFDENFGGANGNMHLAIGKSYHDTYAGDIKKMKSKDYEKLGFNDSVEHTDIIATKNREVSAILKNKSKIVIYADGKFQI